MLGRDNAIGTFSAEELALTKPDSISAVSVSGKLESVINICERNNLGGFVSLIKDFRLSRSLTVEARKLNFPLQLITTVSELSAVLEQRDWRNWPMIFDVPSSCQIFSGQVLDAGIEGILYNSGLTQKACLAIFPQNFLNSSAYIELDDASPTDEVQRRIDSSNFSNFV